ncbi:MAG: DUF2283 domain-containing protein [Methanobacteriaceae archaeon]
MGRRIINWDYDPKRDIIFIFSFPDYDYQESIKFDDMTVDLNPEGEVVAVEIMVPSESLGVEKESLVSPEDFLIEISARNRLLKLNVSLVFRSKKGVINKRIRKETKIGGNLLLKNTLQPVYLDSKIK